MSHRSVQCGGENCPLMDLSKANLNPPHLHPIWIFLDISNMSLKLGFFKYFEYEFKIWINSNILNMNLKFECIQIYWIHSNIFKCNILDFVFKHFDGSL